jgi:hypothetical protein
MFAAGQNQNLWQTRNMFRTFKETVAIMSAAPRFGHTSL